MVINTNKVSIEEVLVMNTIYSPAVWSILGSWHLPEDGKLIARHSWYCLYIDDILITGESDATHLKTLEEVLYQLAQVGLRVKKSKCQFMAASFLLAWHCML